MQHFLGCVASNVALAAALAVLALGLSRAWRSPQLAHALWLLVLLKLVSPPLVAVPISNSVAKRRDAELRRISDDVAIVTYVYDCKVQEGAIAAGRNIMQSKTALVIPAPQVATSVVIGLRRGTAPGAHRAAALSFHFCGSRHGRVRESLEAQAD